MLVTFVRAGGGLTRFPQTSSKADIRLRGSQVEGNVTGSAALVPSCAEEPVRLAGSRRLAQGRLCGSKEGAARRFVFLALKGGATLRRSAAQDLGAQAGMRARLGGSLGDPTSHPSATEAGIILAWFRHS
jgi:hypothetical protein